jgi:hypothetical protein
VQLARFVRPELYAKAAMTVVSASWASGGVALVRNLPPVEVEAVD